MDEQMQPQNNMDQEQGNAESQEQPAMDNGAQNNEAPKTDNAGVDSHKAMAIIGYIIPILFFVPLLSDESKHNPFAKFHANQQLILLIAAVAVNILGSIIPFIGWFLILPIGSIFLIVVAIMGIVNAAKGEMKKLPLIGKYTIIK